MVMMLTIALLQLRAQRRSRLLTLREFKGRFWTLYEDLRADPDKFSDFTRMSVQSFDSLLEMLRPDLEHLDTAYRRTVSPTERLIITLWFLGTGRSYASMHFKFHLGRSTISYIVESTCKAIWRNLHTEVMPVLTVGRWIEIANLFWKKLNFPNCLGAINGKHFRIVMPPTSGNSKNDFSLVLLAMVDADYRFTFVDIGPYGSGSDSANFNNSKLGQLLQSNKLNLPRDRPWPGNTDPDNPFVFVCDEAFGIGEHLIWPYSQRGLNHMKRIFNYRLSRVSKKMESTFGILSNKWRVLNTDIKMTPENAINVIKATCVLHNYVRDKDGYSFDDSLHHCLEKAEWSIDEGSTSGLTIRDEMAQYFLTPAGELSFQEESSQHF